MSAPLVPVILYGLTPHDMEPNWCSRVYFWCKLAAQRLTNIPANSHVLHVDYQRIGYVFWMPNKLAAVRLAIYYDHLRRGQPYQLAAAYP